MIYLIALLHGVPILFIGLASNSKSRAIYTAIFMATLGVITGNPVYMVIDLFAVGLALWFCLATIDEPSQSEAQKPDFLRTGSLGDDKERPDLTKVDHAERLAKKRAARPPRVAIAVTVAPAKAKNPKMEI